MELNGEQEKRIHYMCEQARSQRFYQVSRLGMSVKTQCGSGRQTITG